MMIIDDESGTTRRPRSPAAVNAEVQPKPLRPILMAGGTQDGARRQPARGAMPAAAPGAVPAAGAAPVTMAGPGTIITSSGGDGFGSSALPPQSSGPPTTGAVPVGGTTTAPPASGPTALSPVPVASAPQSPGVGGGVALSPTNPANPLTAQTITPGQGADRDAIAKQQWATWVDSTDPSYKAALRDAKRVGAAAGGLGSGQLRTSIGDLGAQRANAMDVKGQEFLTQANLGSIDDAWKSIGLSERQQGFQNQQQQQAFENELRRLGFSEDMINSAFNRGLQTYQAGQAGGTGSGTMLGGAGTYSGQGQDALEALNNLIRQRASQPSGTAPAPTPASQIYPWMGPGGMNG